MFLTAGKTYELSIDSVGYRLTVHIESRDKLDPRTGEVINMKDLDDAVHAAIDKINSKKWDEIPGMASLPSTCELLIIRLWEWIEDNLPYSCRIRKLAFTDGVRIFEYSGKAPLKHKKRRKQNGTNSRKRI